VLFITNIEGDRMNYSNIMMFHGSGGAHTKNLIHNIFYKHFGNSLLLEGLDSAVFHMSGERLAFTTDSYVVKPWRFPGGDIGKLSICGTVNDLSVAGAKPLYLSCGFIIEEGFPIENLEIIANSMARATEEAGIKIITGDTKVVEKGFADGIYINTAGIGILYKDYEMEKIMPEDKIILTGTIAEHGTAIAVQRYNLKMKAEIKSDCASINKIVEHIEPFMKYIKIMKDPTRGGIATSLNEIAEHASLSIHIFEDKIPIGKEVESLNKLLGIDPLYLACEGRMLIVADGEKSEEILNRLHELESCKDAQIIGRFEKNKDALVYIENCFGGKRILTPLEVDMLPRIC
jgi:hydrogenase expression/formation protein HypE